MARRKPPKARLPVTLAPAIGAGLSVLLLVMTVFSYVPINMDEAQVWRDSQNLSFGVLAGAPLETWMAGMSIAVLGDSLLALRLPTLLSVGAFGVLLWRTQRQHGADGQAAAWITICAAPLLFFAALRIGNGVIAGVLFLAFLHSVTLATDQKITKKAPERLTPWCSVGVLGALCVLASYWTLIPMSALCVWGGLTGRGRWRGGVMAAGLAALLLMPHLLWQGATGLATFAHIAEWPGTQNTPFWVGLGIVALGPLALFALGNTDDSQARICAVSLIGAAVVAAAIGRADMTPLILSLAPLSILAAWAMSKKGAALGFVKLQAVIGVCAAVALSGLTTLYAYYGTGLPAFADPFAQMRMQAAFCEEVLLALDENAAEGLVARDHRTLLPCAWQAGQPDLPLISLELPPFVSLHERLMHGPLALEGTGLLVTYWPDDAADLVQQYEWVDLLGEYAVPLHVEREMRFDLTVVEAWRG